MSDFVLIAGALLLLAILSLFFDVDFFDMPWEWKGGNKFILKGTTYSFLVETKSDHYYILDGEHTREPKT